VILNIALTTFDTIMITRTHPHTRTNSHKTLNGMPQGPF